MSIWHLQALTADVNGPAVLESHFHRGVAEPELLALGVPLVQVYCRCPVELAWKQYQRRRDDPARHPGHLPEHQDDIATLSWRTSPPSALDLGSPLLEVDTTSEVEIPALVTALRGWANQHADGGGQRGAPRS